MNLTALEYFREVVETKSISKVATIRHISQSALSQNIQKLEDELGFSLLERSNRGVEPTDAGKILFKHSGTMLRVLEKMKEELESLHYSMENIRINGSLSLVDYSLPCVLYKVKKKYPSYNFEMHARSNMDSMNDLINDLTDLCFVTEEPCDDRLDFAHIGKERIVLVANSQSRIPDIIDVKDLLKHEMVLLDDEALTISSFIKHKLKDVGLTIDKIPIMFKVDSIPAAKSSISNNLGICFLPYMAVKKELYEKKYKIVEVNQFDLDFKIYVVSQKKCNRNRSVEDVYNYFVENGEKDFC
ncbi:MAG: LysR family transcriptional regulator [Firmicutes bacterium]|nr:LysR family transcriptional regulator [Bacillota bacterium]